MNLFFESSRQASSFLVMVPVGFAVALCLEMGRFSRIVQPLTDVFVLLAAGFAVLAGIVFCRDDTLRLYHLLGLLTGVLICTQGIGKIIRWVARRQDLRHRTEK